MHMAASITATFLTCLCSFSGAYEVILANGPRAGEAGDFWMVPAFIASSHWTGCAQKPCYTLRQNFTILIIVDDRIPSQMSPGKPQSGGSTSVLGCFCVDWKPELTGLSFCFI